MSSMKAPLSQNLSNQSLKFMTMEQLYESEKIKLHLKSEYSEISDLQDQFTEFRLCTHTTTTIGPEKLPCKDAEFSVRVPRFILPQEESQTLISGLIVQAGLFDCSSTEIVTEILQGYHEDVTYHSMYAPIGTAVITADLKIEVAHPSLRVTMKRARYNEEDRETCKKRLKVASCAICMEDYVPKGCVYETPCGHVFHPKCISQWRDLKKTCPICRHEF